jgi:hypothetical protein
MKFVQKMYSLFFWYIFNCAAIKKVTMMADKKLGIPRKLKTEMHKQLKIRTDMNSDAPYESAVPSINILI